MPFMLNLLAPLGAVISLFLSYRVARILGGILLAEGIYLIMNMFISNSLSILVSNVSSLNLDCHIAHFINASGVLSASSVFLSIMLSAALFRKISFLIMAILVK